MKFISWNVNGIRAILQKGFIDFVIDSGPDVLLIQETRAAKEQVDLVIPGYTSYWSAARKKGYSGTAIFTKEEPLEVTYGIGNPELDNEGRVITLELDDYYVVNVYTPNSQRGLSRLVFRTEHWDPAFLEYLENLEYTKPVILGGDMNVAHMDIDLADPKGNERNAGFTMEEREGFDRILDAGFVDTFREFVTDGGHYTWWAYFNHAREKNIGWRIDYFCISLQLMSRLLDASILPDVMGSDHCPITMDLE